MTTLFGTFEKIGLCELSVVEGLCPHGQTTDRDKNDLRVKTLRKIRVEVNKVYTRNTSLGGSSVFVDC